MEFLNALINHNNTNTLYLHPDSYCLTEQKLDTLHIVKLTSTDFTSKDNKEVYTTFLGDFTSGEQQYALILVLDAPQGIKSTYGFNSAGWNAVKVARKVIQNIVE